MTFQPPPPGGTPPPPPPPSGQWGPPPGGNNYPAPGPGFDPKTINPLDWGIFAAGFLALIFSFFDYYTVSYTGSFGSQSASASAWHGFFGWFAALVALLSAGVIAVALFAPQVKLAVAPRLAALIGFAVATICVILALLVIPDGDIDEIPGVDDGHGFGYWASLVVIIAGLVMSFMRFQQGGGKLPGALANVPNLGQHGPQGGTYGPPPQGTGSYGQTPGGYGQPPQAPQAPQAPPPGNNPPPPPPGYGPPQ